MALYEVYDEIKAMILEGIGNMNWKRFFMKIIIVSLIIAACVGGCSYFNRTVGLPDDHAAEEALEEKIKQETGVDLDLTPLTPEGDKMYPIYQHELS